MLTVAEKNARRRARYAESAAIREAAIARSCARWADPAARVVITARRKERQAEINRRAAERHRGNGAGAVRRREKMTAYRAKYRTADPERARQQAADKFQRYRSRKRSALVESVKRQVVFERDEGICGICGTAVDPADWHLDHVVPLAAGGEHSYANVQVTHPICNQRKGARAC